MKSEGKITLTEIARRAGVSNSMVSAIYNGKGRSSEEVRRKVLSMLEEAGYRAKHARKPMHLLMELGPAIFQGYEHLKQMAGIQSLLTEEGSRLLVEFLPTLADLTIQDSAIEKQVREIADQKPGGIFVRSGERSFKIVSQICDEANIPLVQVGFDIESPSRPAVVVDSFSGAYTAVKYLLSRGHARIATIRWEAEGVRNSHRKHAGYLAALAEAEIAPREEYIRSIRTHPYSPGWLAARELLVKMLELPSPPTALFVENSAISFSLLYPMAEDGGQIPDRLRKMDIVHFEDVPLDLLEVSMVGRMFYPSRDVLMIAIDWYAIGRTAARVMIDSINSHGRLDPKIVRMNPKLQKARGLERQDIIVD